MNSPPLPLFLKVVPVNDITARISRIEEKIEAACLRCGRSRGEIRLMGVTKFQTTETIEAAWKAGLRLFGESRVQEASSKFTGFREKHAGLELHLVGSLQRNKAKTAAAFFDCIQSVDRESLIDELGVLTRDRENPLMVLLEYRTGEETKSGFSDQDSLFRAVEKLLSFPGLRPMGFMTMAPFTDDTVMVRSAFRKLAALRADAEKRFPGQNWSNLSMGMTNDFEIAIEEGSTLIRIGTALFGECVT